MDKSKKILIVAGVLLLSLILFFSFFKVAKVTEVSWDKNYNYSSKETYDTWLFKEMLIEKYGVDHVSFELEQDSVSLLDTNQLFIFFGHPISLSETKFDSLAQLIDIGNEVFFITNHVDLPYSRIRDYYAKQVFYQDTAMIIESCADSSLELEYNYFFNDFDEPKPHYSRLLVKDQFEQSDSISLESYLCVNDSLVMFGKYSEHGRSFYFHSIPNSFCNVGTEQTYYLDHFNEVFSQFNSTTVILDHPFVGTNPEVPPESPIKYILETPALAWAYFLTLFGILVYLIFGGKRKQKYIPLVKKNENTSLQYVHILSELFKGQNQNHKLVNHMKENFEQHVRNHYFIKPGHPKYLDELVLKSKINKAKIETIYSYFDKASKGYTVTDHELNLLYNHIEYFNKISK